MYTTWCDARGKVIDDGTVSRLGESRFRLTSAEPNFRWLGLKIYRAQLWVGEQGYRDNAPHAARFALDSPLPAANEAYEHVWAQGRQA